MANEKTVFIKNVDYDNYIDEIQKNYDKRQKSLTKWYKYLSIIRAICILSIPLILVIDIQTKLLTAIVSVVASICEFYIRFKDYNHKINSINKSVSDLTFEYNLFSEKAGNYSSKTDEEARKLYVLNTSKIIKDTDTETFRTFNEKANEKLE